MSAYNLRHYYWPRLKYAVLSRLLGRGYIYATTRRDRQQVWDAGDWQPHD